VSAFQGRLMVTDNNNRRVLVWSTWPTVDGQDANEVFGQENFSSSEHSVGGLSSATGFVNPVCAFETEDRYFFVEYLRPRISVLRKTSP
jgi:hypothetical protein